MHTFTQTRSPLCQNANANPLDVVKIKSALSALGVYEAPDWGLSQFPDAELFRAIKAFQKAQGLKTDGVIKPDGETLTALQEKLKGAKARTQTQTAALALQDMGRGGDEILAHITPEQAQLLHDATDGGSINPETGLLEFMYGGNKFGRERKAKAKNRADSAQRASEGRQQSGDWSSDRGRTLGYNDFNPGGIHGDKDLSGNKRSGAELDRHNKAVEANRVAKERAKQAQLAKIQKAAAAKLQHEHNLKAAAEQRHQEKVTRAQNLSAVQNEDTANAPGMMTTKSTQAPAIGQNISNTAVTGAPATPASARKSDPTSKPISNSVSNTGTRSQSAGVSGLASGMNFNPNRSKKDEIGNMRALERNKKEMEAKKQKAAENQFTQSGSFSFTSTPQVQAMTAPPANKTKALGPSRVNNYLAEVSKPQYQPGTRPPGMTAADARKAAWNAVKGGLPSGENTEAQPTPNTPKPRRYPGMPPRKPSLSFNDAIALREVKDLPNGGYDAVAGNPNIAGKYALGRYQMRASALKATHYLDKTGDWADKDGIKSYRDFLDSPTVQEKAIKEYHGVLGKELSNNGSTKHLGKKIDGIKAKITITRSGLVAAAHRQGARKVREYLKHMSGNGWKSDFNDLDEETSDAYKSVETRLREFQNKPLP